MQKITSFLFKRKSTIAFLFLTAAVFLALPGFASAAGFWDTMKTTLGVIAALPITLPLALVAALIFFITYVFWAGAGVASLMLSWVLSPNFTSFSYTNPATNPVIAMGLGITQGFVNMLLVVVLIYIALATILRLAGYETKKLLVTFIIVALLVNFSPVICGLIVDAANIFMNFFLKTGLSERLGTIVTQGKSILDTFLSIFKVENLTLEKKALTGFVTDIAGLAITGLFYLVAALIYGLYTMLFLVRYFVIWILVILSPIAFACYILPATKKFWNMWWQQFIQWSIIGIAGAFFLNLAELFVNEKDKLGNIAQTGEWYKIGNVILPLMVPLVFMGLGLIYAVQTSAMGGSAVIGLTTRAQKWVGKKAGGRAWKKIEDTTRLRSGVGGAINWYDRFTGRVDKKTGKVKRSSKAIGSLTRWAIPDKLRHYGEYRAAMDEFKPKIKDQSSINLSDGLANGRFTGEETAALVDMLVRERGDSQDIVKGYKRKLYGTDNEKEVSDEMLFSNKNFLNDKYLGRALTIAKQAGGLGKILRMDPRLARVAATQNISGKNITPEQGMINALEDVKTSDISQWEKEVIKDVKVVEAAMALQNEAIFRAMGGLKRGVKTCVESFDTAFSKWADSTGQGASATWDNYQLHLRAKYNISPEDPVGYAKALGNPRFVTAGWRAPVYKTKEQRQEQSKNAPMPSPIEAAGMPPQPPRKPPAADVGESTERINEAKRRAEEAEKRRAKKRRPPEAGAGV